LGKRCTSSLLPEKDLRPTERDAACAVLRASAKDMVVDKN
jgi:hypothetical protein